MCLQTGDQKTSNNRRVDSGDSKSCTSPSGRAEDFKRALQRAGLGWLADAGVVRGGGSRVVSGNEDGAKNVSKQSLKAPRESSK